MLWLVSGNLKEGRVKEYIAWLNKNEKLLQKHAPKGLKYHGSYFYVLGFGRFDVMTAWEMKNYGDFDTFRKWDDKVWDRLGAEQSDFFAPGVGESTLLREFNDVVFVEPSKPKKPKK